jgi:hypothetical protein
VVDLVVDVVTVAVVVEVPAEADVKMMRRSGNLLLNSVVS